MALFGTGAPKFVGTGDPNSSTVLLPGAYLASFTPVIPDIIEQVAPITGFRRFIQGGDAPTGGSNYSEFVVQVRLFDTTAYATSLLRSQKAAEIWAYNQKYVYFFPFTSSGAVAVKNNAGTQIRFFLEVSFGLHESNQKYDVINLFFKSEDFTDISKSII